MLINFCYLKTPLQILIKTAWNLLLHAKRSRGKHTNDYDCMCVCMCVWQREWVRPTRDDLISHKNMPSVYHDLYLNWTHAEELHRVKCVFMCVCVCICVCGEQHARKHKTDIWQITCNPFLHIRKETLNRPVKHKQDSAFNTHIINIHTLTVRYRDIHTEKDRAIWGSATVHRGNL